MKTERLHHQPHTTRLRPTRFENFYSAEWAQVYRPLAVTLRDPDLAREATDEAMTRAFQRWATVRRYDNPAGWVYRTALNWALSQLRRRRWLVQREVADGSRWDPPPSDPAVSRALARLPLEQRAVVVLRYLCGHSQAEISDELQIPVGTVRSRLARALSRLREEVGT